MANDPTTIILGGATLKWKATLPASDPDKAASYSNALSNIKSAKMVTEDEKKEHYGTYSGVAKRDRIISVKKKMHYEFVTDEFTSTLWDLILGGNAALVSPAEQAVGYGYVAYEMEDEPVIVKGTGVPDKGIMIHHSFKCYISAKADAEVNAEGEPISATVTVDVDLGTPGARITSPRPVVA